MIIGDPYKFAFIVNPIKEWSDDKYYKNGILFLCVDGKQYPSNIKTSCLNSDIYSLLDKYHDLCSTITNVEIFNMEKHSAFKRLYQITYPDDENIMNDYRFIFSPPFMEDIGCFLFIVSDGCRCRILASELIYNNETYNYNTENIDVREYDMDCNILKKMWSDLQLYYNNEIKDQQ